MAGDVPERPSETGVEGLLPKEKKLLADVLERKVDPDSRGTAVGLAPKPFRNQGNARVREPCWHRARFPVNNHHHPRHHGRFRPDFQYEEQAKHCWIARDLGISKNTVLNIVKRHRQAGRTCILAALSIKCAGNRS
ncbi:MAG: hypothetical protein F4213_16190 [Boseongicola sp. SB0677_bin_26]|nr:hypothetical protein [Boseongicola sp. SB0665_bin_10]MYG27534.1 hypothetical protein [Boseongicola sp. SB0677_bin_26]